MRAKVFSLGEYIRFSFGVFCVDVKSVHYLTTTKETNRVDRQSRSTPHSKGLLNAQRHRPI